jgi:hypothetical protein
MRTVNALSVQCPSAYISPSLSESTLECRARSAGFDSLCFTVCQELHSIPIDEPHLCEIEYEAVPVVFDLSPQFLQVFGGDSAAQPEDHASPVRDVLDFEPAAVLAVFSTELTFEVRPELLQDVGRHVHAELHAEL